MAELKKLPPVPLYVACNTLDPKSAYHFEYKGRKYCGAHPDFWERFACANGLKMVPVFMDVTIWYIDDGENPDKRAEFFGAWAAVIAETQQKTGTTL